MKPSSPSPFHPQTATRTVQHGVALIVSLILLLVITIIGLAAIRLSSTEEKMASNTVDRTQAFQVAEATLQFAASTILPPNTPPNPATFSAAYIDCANNPCTDNPANDNTVPDSAWVFPPTAKDASGGAGQIVALYGNKPSYLIQYMGQCSTEGGNFQFTNDQNNQGGGNSLKSSGQCYRITARAGAPSPNRAQVVLQAIYRTN